jgi:excisionase family DNA binding protein
MALCDGCGFRLISDLSASRVMDWLASLRRGAATRVPLPSAEAFTRSEAAQLLGMTPTAFRDTVRRHRLPVTGKGPKRRFPRATVEAVRELASKGHSVQTTNYYLSHLKSFCHWLVKDRHMADKPVAHLEEGNVKVDRRHDRRELTADELRTLLAAHASERTFRRWP